MNLFIYVFATLLSAGHKDTRVVFDLYKGYFFFVFVFGKLQVLEREKMMIMGAMHQEWIVTILIR